MVFVIGIDGGGTKTKLMVSSLEAECLHIFVSGPSNILSSGYETAKKSIRDVMQKVVEAGYSLEDCRAVCIGVAGAGREAVKNEIEGIIRACGYQGTLIVTHDAETALIGGIGGSAGVLIIAGTGTICYGQTKEGVTHRVSGWGHIIGDEGSAYSLGIKIVNAVMRAYDGRGKKSVLTELLLRSMKILSEEQVVSCIYKPEVTKRDIASYAILIDEACKLKDEVALKIIEDTVEELFACVSAAFVKLNFIDQDVKVVINGSVLVNNQYVYKGFCNRLRKTYPKAIVCPMLYGADYGAVLRAIEEINKNR